MRFIPAIILTLLLIPVLFFTGKLGVRGWKIQHQWVRVEATVFETPASREAASEAAAAKEAPGSETPANAAPVTDAVKLRFPWKGASIDHEIWPGQGYSGLTQGQILPLYVNPDNTSAICPASFAEMWGGAIALGVVALMLLLFIFVSTRMGPTIPPEQMAQMEELRRMAEMGGPMSAHFEVTSAQALPPPVADDGSVIVLREPTASWKMNFFWGLLFGLLFVVPPLLAPKDGESWKKCLSVAAGLAWMGYMGRCAIQNRGRIIRCGATSIEISEPFGGREILLSDVKKVTRRDVGKKLKDIDDKYRSLTRDDNSFSTNTRLVVFNLHDAAGRVLLRWSDDMEPASERRRFLERLKALNGGKIADE